jgi:hypothetical protein
MAEAVGHPQQFICPLSRQLMVYPKQIRSCGHVFERDYIRAHFSAHHHECPSCPPVNGQPQKVYETLESVPRQQYQQLKDYVHHLFQERSPLANGDDVEKFLLCHYRFLEKRDTIKQIVAENGKLPKIQQDLKNICEGRLRLQEPDQVIGNVGFERQLVDQFFHREQMEQMLRTHFVDLQRSVTPALARREAGNWRQNIEKLFLETTVQKRLPHFHELLQLPDQPAAPQPDVPPPLLEPLALNHIPFNVWGLEVLVSVTSAALAYALVVGGVFIWPLIENWTIDWLVHFATQFLIAFIILYLFAIGIAIGGFIYERMG